MERQIVIQYKKEEIVASVHYPSEDRLAGTQRRLPLIVICHGFVGSRIGVDRLFVKTARELADDGFLVVRFDYIGCGESSGQYGEEGLESMIDQTRVVLDYAFTIGDIDPTRVTLLGHSLGGAVAILTAVRDRRVKNLVLWSAVGYPFNDIVKITGRQIYDQAIKSGTSDYLGYELKPVFYDSLGTYQPFQEAQKFTGDVLVIHGTSDDDIPVDYAFLYQKVFWTRPEGRCDKEIIFQANHTYSSGEHRQILISKTKTWLADLHRARGDWYNWVI